MEVGGQFHPPTKLLYPQGKDPGTHQTGSWVGPTPGLDMVAKK